MIPERVAAVVLVRFGGLEHRVAHHGLDEAINALARAREQLLGRVPMFSLLCSDAMSVLACYDTPLAALSLALAAPPTTTRVLALGELVGTPPWALGPPVAQVTRAAVLADPGELLATDAFVAALDLPEGIGIFRAPEHRELLMGCPIHVLRDYR